MIILYNRDCDNVIEIRLIKIKFKKKIKFITKATLLKSLCND